MTIIVKKSIFNDEEIRVKKKRKKEGKKSHFQ